MKLSPGRWVAIAVAVVAVVVGGIVVATRSTGPGHAHSPAAANRRTRTKGALAAVSAVPLASEYLGLSRAQLRAEIRSGRTLAQIAEATPGRSASGLVQALVAARVARIARSSAGGGASGSNARARAVSIKRRTTAEVLLAGAELSAAASYLGLTPVRIGGDLGSGETLAQIAATRPGRTPAGLIDRLVRAEQRRLAAEQAAGTISHAQAAALAAALASTITAAVEQRLSLQG